jgi:hypothetical protein
LNFNGVASGETLEQSFTLTSNGTDAVNVTNARFMEGSDEGIFTFSEEINGVLEPNATRAVSVSFTRPADEMVTNTYQATLVLESDSDGGDVIINLVANP